MEDGSMSFIPNAVPRSRGFLALAFSIFLAAALLHPGATAAQEVKQIKLTDKHIQGFVGASKDMARLYAGANPDQPNPKVDAQAAAVAKKNGFASLGEYDDASMNISMIMAGIDPPTKKITEPPPQHNKKKAGLQGGKNDPHAGKKKEPAQHQAGGQKRKHQPI